MANLWNKKSEQLLKRAVANFNNKIKRLERSERDLILPDKITYHDLKQEITSGWELRRYLKDLSSFTKRGMESTITTKGGVKLSKYEYEKTLREQKRLYDKLGRKIKKIENITPRTFGIPEDVTYKQMGLQQLANMKARRKNIGKRRLNTLDKEGLKELVKLLNVTRSREKYQDEVFRNNYMDKMLFDLAYMSGYDMSKIKEIREKLNTLTDRQFMKLFNEDLGIQAIRDFYPSVHRKTSESDIEKINKLYDELYNNVDSLVLKYRK